MAGTEVIRAGAEVMAGAEEMAGTEAGVEIGGIDLGGGEPPVSDCERVCEEQALCMVDVCSGYEQEDTSMLIEDCLVSCTPAFASVLDAHMSCQESVDFLLEIRPILAEQCTQSNTESERVGLGDTSPLTCSGDYCPSARLSSFELPSRSDQGALCNIIGSTQGSQLGQLSGIFGSDLSLDDLLTPDEVGQLPLDLITHLSGWTPGLTGNQTGSISAHFYDGVHVTPGQALLDPRSVEMGVAARRAPGTLIRDGLFQTPPSRLSMTLPLMGHALPFTLEQASLAGDISLEGSGFRMSDGVLTGYLTRSSFVVILDSLYSVCDQPNTLEVCDVIGGFLSGDINSDLALISSFITSDVILTNQELAACSDERSSECNATSVCVFVEMEPVEVLGIAD
jgi:hypothetical protein